MVTAAGNGAEPAVQLALVCWRYLRLFEISPFGFVFEDCSFCHSEIAFATNVLSERTNDSNGDFRLYKARALSGRAGSPDLGLMTHMPERTDDLPKMEMPNPACTAAWIEARLALE
jgi:hypothetical protein